MRLSQEEFQRKKEREKERREFNKKIEEDKLGISRIKKKRTMKFSTYRIIKIVLLSLTVLMFFLYSPALLPLIVFDAFMLIATKQIQRAKNKNITRKYRIKIAAIDSIIAVMLIVITCGIFTYSSIQAYKTSSEFNNKSEDQLRQELVEKGIPTQAITFMLKRQQEMNSNGTLMKRAVISAMTLNTGERNIFTGAGYAKRGKTMIGKAAPGNADFQNAGTPPPGGGGNLVFKEKGGATRAISLGRELPLQNIFMQIFSSVCMVIIGGLVIVGVINIISSRKYGEIKEVKIDAKFLEQLSPNSECPCGSGKKYKNCCMR